MKFKFIYAIVALAVLAGCKDREKDEKVIYGAGGTAGESVQSEDNAPRINGMRVYFAFDSSTITPDARANLNAQAAYLKENPDTQIVIEGHCDERGTREYNYALGARRADAAKKVIVKDGVAAGRIGTVSYSFDRPQKQGTGEEIWKWNRNAKTVVKE